MRFEGTVVTHASRSRVWGTLIDPVIFARIAPGVHAMTTLVPDEHFQLLFGLPTGMKTATLQADIRMEQRVDLEEIAWTTTVPFGRDTIEAVGQMLLSGEATCSVNYSAEINHPPHAFPSPILHTVVSNAIRTFFTNLKKEVERTS